MIKRNKSIKLLILLAVTISAVSPIAMKEAFALTNNKTMKNNQAKTYESTLTEKEYSTPKQVNVHMGSDPSKEVNITYTTITGDLETKVNLNKAGETEKITVNGDNSEGNGGKYFHKIAVTNLEPNTQYEYTVGVGEDVYNGTFKTAPEKESNESFKFAFLADPQVATTTDAKALGATMAEVNKIDDLSFVYLAGDLTNTSINEEQWDNLFNNNGLFPSGGQDMFGNNLIATVQGNHDNSNLTRHINTPADAGNIAYSYEYGPGTFVMLNLEEATYNAEAREKQKEYLTEVVREAKSRDQWVFVGFHKSIYTGASHIEDSDVVETRKYWGPVLAELDVDVVMQGHDHVYSRGFITADGYNANPDKDDNGNVIKKDNAPLYTVGGHAGGIKWYSKTNYTVGVGDPLAPGYSFLDVNSNDTDGDVNREQTIVEFQVSENEITMNTYMFKYDHIKDEITKEKYLYDTVTLVKDTSDYEVKLSDMSNVGGETGSEFNVSLDINKFPIDKDIRGAEVVINVPSELMVKNVDLNSNIINADNWDYNVDNGELRIALTSLDKDPIYINNVSGDKNIANITFMLNEDKNPGDTIEVYVKSFIFRCQDDVDVDYGLNKATSNIGFKGLGQVAARELYVSEGTEVIPSNMKVVAVEIMEAKDTTSVKFDDIEFFYSPEFTENTGEKTYVALVPEDVSVEALSDINRYTLLNDGVQAKEVVFGDINNDGIDAHDVLASISAWMKKSQLDNKDIISINVNGDGKVNTINAIDIVNNYITGKGFDILSK